MVGRMCIMQPGEVRTPLWDKSVGAGDHVAARPKEALAHAG